MPTTTTQAPTETAKAKTPTHICYLLTYPKGSPEDYRTGVVYVLNPQDKRVISIRRMVHRLTWAQYQLVKVHPITARYLEKGWMQVVAEGENIVRDAIAAGTLTKAQTIENTIKNCADRELLEVALAYVEDSEDLSSRDSEAFQIRKMIRKRLKAMDGEGIALASFSNTPPTIDEATEDFTFF
jgi:hypothetical protein